MSELDEDEYYEKAAPFEEEDSETYQVSEKGLEKVLEWVRFQVQLHEMTTEEGHGFEDHEEDPFAEVPFLIGFLLPEICFYRGIPLPDEDGLDEA